ncbi:alpha/beta hydrolase, partial [Enterococcus faecium]
AHEMDLDLSPKWAVVGQSQGGGAAVATARWATEFSAGSGLDYRGVVATGTPAGVESIVKQAGPQMVVPPELGPMGSAYTAYIVAALREARPDLDLDQVLTPA